VADRYTYPPLLLPYLNLAELPVSTSSTSSTSDIPAYYEETLPNGRVIRLSRQVVHDWMAEKNVGIDEAISALMNLKSDE